MGGLSYDNKPTGVIYGFLKTVSALQDSFNTNHVIFCWDSKTNKREEIYPAYKQNRRNKYKDLTEEEIELEKEFRFQMGNLRRIYLPEIGYKNTFIQKGYESDDIIARICHNLPNGDEAIIVSSDKDLYQLISGNVSFYNPSGMKILTLQGFVKKYGIKPFEWRMVKAIAGCPTDGVAGVIGVGEKTAIKYLRGELKNTSKIFIRITSQAGMDIYKRNRKLVILPFKGTKTFELQEDELSEEGWHKVTKALGMNSIRDKAPFGGRREKKTKKGLLK